MAQLGRITGPLLNANLHREGVDLKISNTTFDSTPVLFFDVENGSVGIKRDDPFAEYQLDVNNDVLTTRLQVDNFAKIDNVIIKAPNIFSTVVGPLNISPTPSTQVSLTAQFLPAETNGVDGPLTDVNTDGFINRDDLRDNEFSFGDLTGSPLASYPFTNIRRFLFAFEQSFVDQFVVNTDTLYLNEPDGTPIIGFTVKSSGQWDRSSYGSSTYGFQYIEFFGATSEVVYPPSIAALPRSSSADFTARAQAVTNLVNASLVPGNNYLFTKGPYVDPTPVLNFQRMRSDDLDFNDNTISGISSNHSIDIRSATGTVEFPSSTNIYGTLGVTGDITMDGNLSKLGDLILGDELYNPNVGGGQGDTIEIIPDFSQSIIPGDDATYNLGSGTLVDSSVRRWNNAFITDNLVNVDTTLPLEIRVSDQQKLDGVNNEIFSLQSNDDLVLAPDTGINIIEWTQWNEITATSTSASISGFNLTVAGTITGTFVPGMLLTGVGIIPGTIITGTSTGSDSAGVYTVNFNYDGSGSRPSPTGTISISGATDAITNLTYLGGGPREYPESPLTFANTGIGYLRFTDTNGFLVPAAGNTDRPARPELGDSRWNTDRNILEVFAGTIESVTGIAVVTGLPNQIQTGLTGTTNGNGVSAEFSITIASGALSTITITNVGQGYTTGDLITISGSSFTGGATPTNNVVLTVGAQTDDGYQLSTGGGAEVDVPLMEDLSDVYSLMLG
jgi:hypothetical protein